MNEENNKNIICMLVFYCINFIGKNVLKDGKEREYIKSDKYYEENIENININEVNFKFLQVNEVANVNEAFYKKYDSYKEVVVEDNKNYDVFEKYTKVDVAFDQGYSGMRCYLNEDEVSVELISDIHLNMKQMTKILWILLLKYI